MDETKLLLADDEDTLRENLKQVLQEEGFDVVACGDGKTALRALKETHFDAIITDLRMPGLSGMQLIDHAKKLVPSASIIVITAYGEVASAVEAMKKGVKDYICKPIIFDELIFRLKRLILHNDIAKENKLLKQQIKQSWGMPTMIGQSKAMQQIRQTARRVSQAMSNVLIYGESGTGKEILAREIHYGGITRDKPFVAVNCGGLIETLMESELFGHRRGAFTGADADRMGYFEAADGGSLFLDEISCLPPNMQAVLLRAIEQKAIIRVGDHRAKPVTLRIIAATNRNLEEAIKSGAFREDLYYRLDVIQITLPPLRERPEDIKPLAEYFVKKYNAELKCTCPGFQEQALQALEAYPWPGNVRELENIVERTLIFRGNEWVREEDLCIAGEHPVAMPNGTCALKEATRQFERNLIVKTLISCNANRTAAARKLDIGLSSLYRKIEELNICLPNTHVHHQV